MFIIYSVLLTLAFVILSPRFLFDALRRGKYAAGFWQRLGYLPAFHSENKPVIWLHCVSVGETQAARPLVDELLKRYPGHKLVISTTTATGQEIAQKIFAGKAALVFYFPFDWRFVVRRVLKNIQPKLVLLMETEIWFNFLRIAHKSGVKLAIVNGRLSERSVNRYMYIRAFMTRVLHYVDLALMQSPGDAGRIKELGMKNSRIRVTGNIKFDQAADADESVLTAELRRRFNITENTNAAPLLLATSTHKPEERIIIEAFAKLRVSGNHVRLMLVPRHPERFDEVAGLIADSEISYVRRSDVPSADDHDAEIILLDSIGELRAVYPLAQVVFVGGSLISRGGQSILEPAVARKAIVTGPHTMNFAAIVKEFLEKEALVQLPKMEERSFAAKLAETFTGLLQDQNKRDRLSENAFELMQSNSGGAAKTVEFLKPLLEKPAQK